MRVLVVYESLYGTNLRIAQAIAGGFGSDATITIVGAEAAPAVVAADVDLIVVGGPNHIIKTPFKTASCTSKAEILTKNLQKRKCNIAFTNCLTFSKNPFSKQRNWCTFIVEGLSLWGLWVDKLL